MIDFNSLEKEGTVFIYIPGTPGPGQRNRGGVWGEERRVWTGQTGME